MFLEFQILRIMRGKYRQQSESLNAYSVDPDPVDLKKIYSNTRTEHSRKRVEVGGACVGEPGEANTISQSVSPVVMATLKFMSMI